MKARPGGRGGQNSRPGAGFAEGAGVAALDASSASEAAGGGSTADLAWTKRLLERLSEPGFSKRLRQDPEAAGRELGLPWSPARVRHLWDPQAPGEPSPLATAWRDLIEERLGVRERLRQEGRVGDPVIQAWRDRQVQRCFGELGPSRSESVVHSPFAVELSRGCSVGCWFCGLAAGPLEDVWPYTPDNARTWRGVLEVLREELGPAAKWGFCYWATEPLDNPDYERFLDDFHDRMGVIPQTTTAAALRDPSRTRRLVRRAREATPVVSRFSVLTPGQLLRIHQTFTPEELLEVELVIQGPGSPLAKAVAGRARGQQRERARQEGLPVDQEERAGTVACVSGFLVQMTERRVQLVSPCRACDRWPKGYIVFGERRFADPEGFRQALRSLRGAAMPGSVRALPWVRPGRVWRVFSSDEGLIADSGLVQVHLRAPGRRPGLHALADLLQTGSHDADTLGTLLFYTCGQAEETTRADLELLFQRGVLDEEPAAGEGPR